MKNENHPRLFLIAGPPRCGTTFMADWIGKSWPEPHLWFRESGVTKAIHEMISALDFNRRDHQWGFDFLKEDKREDRAAVIGHLRRMAFEIYRRNGGVGPEEEIAWILDKEPVFFPDGADLYRHALEAFPGMRFLFLIRDHRSILNSMIRRDFSRGPYPRKNFYSPYALDATWIENVNCDIPDRDSHGGYGFLDEPSPWSFRKCCVNLRNAIAAIHEALPDLGDHARIVRYEDLAKGAAVRAMVEEFAGVTLAEGIPFEPRPTVVESSHSEELEIERELVSTGALDKLDQLDAIASEGLEPFL